MKREVTNVDIHILWVVMGVLWRLRPPDWSLGDYVLTPSTEPFWRKIACKMFYVENISLSYLSTESSNKVFQQTPAVNSCIMDPFQQRIKFFTDFSLVSNFILPQLPFHKFWNYCNKVLIRFFACDRIFEFAGRNFLLQWTWGELKIKDEFHNPISFGKPLRTQL